MKTNNKKAILISSKPENAWRLASGKQKFEPRKTIPEDFTGWVYVYVTQAEPFIVLTSNKDASYHGKVDEEFICNGRVACRFWYGKPAIKVEYLDELEKYVMPTDVEALTLRTFDSLDNYFDKKTGGLWPVEKLEIFDIPIELEDFGLQKPFISWGYVTDIIK